MRYRPVKLLPATQLTTTITTPTFWIAAGDTVELSIDQKIQGTSAASLSIETSFDDASVPDTLVTWTTRSLIDATITPVLLPFPGFSTAAARWILDLPNESIILSLTLELPVPKRLRVILWERVTPLTPSTLAIIAGLSS